ncbi:arylsulfatase [Labilibaculum antarcticum]|uniref:N-acetylgalactosamine-4-sulfatase n=1 Tax=Labilibaculum antarcticum TaxID=1717717 RepID=A0A1Y1CLB0_9BACT|nr:arylsulfatase [Labilibaculum antarcticum]BAX81080.1 N-acetylgalactosamine-4-sulfatase [Labilibaculum antarcticum]
MIEKTSLFRVVLLILLVANLLSEVNAQRTPNVILILTDDQGIGDLACHGNPWIKTPNLDAFYKESVRLTDFHVSPYCAPTRGAIMTGKYPINNGAWATFKGRDALPENTSTMADVFKQNGYTTGIFGKWHLGDNYPVRPTDCGFYVAIHHKAGGVGELSDYWGNSYFDDVYYVNNEPKQFEGYCTDVWFKEAIKFIESNKESPFFVYLPTNAPHSPWFVDDKYSDQYRDLEGEEIVSANFYGMITNIDENIGKLDKYLKKKGLLDNTILIFMTDNGSSGGISRDGKIGYNKGYRGMKGAKTEGGHRVPFFIRWPDGKIEGGKDINDLTGHIDLLPTLAGLCQLNLDEDMNLDGVDFSSLLLKKKNKLEERTMFVHNRQDWRPPMDEKQTCLMNDKWRLVNGNELYNIDKDQYQSNNIAHQHPELVKTLLNDNARFVKIAKTRIGYQELPVNVIGNDEQDEITLTIQHAIGEDGGIWKCEQVAEGMRNTNNTHALRVDRTGTYEISCCRWPKECPGPIWGVPEENPKNLYNYTVIKPEKVRISIANQMLEKEIEAKEEAVIFKVRLEKGKTLLVNDFIEGGEKYGVYYTYIKRVD